jgi:hypothetical protein
MPSRVGATPHYGCCLDHDSAMLLGGTVIIVTAARAEATAFAKAPSASGRAFQVPGYGGRPRCAMPGLCRSQVERLAEAPGAPETRVEAAAGIGSLISRVVLTLSGGRRSRGAALRRSGADPDARRRRRQQQEPSFASLARGGSERRSPDGRDCRQCIPPSIRRRGERQPLTIALGRLSEGPLLHGLSGIHVAAARHVRGDLRFLGGGEQAELWRTCLTELGRLGASDDQLISVSGHTKRQTLSIYFLTEYQKAVEIMQRRRSLRNAA